MNNVRFLVCLNFKFPFLFLFVFLYCIVVFIIVWGSVSAFKTDGRTCCPHWQPLSASAASHHDWSSPATSDSWHRSSQMVDNHWDSDSHPMSCAQWLVAESMTWSHQWADGVIPSRIAGTHAAHHDCKRRGSHTNIVWPEIPDESRDRYGSCPAAFWDPSFDAVRCRSRRRHTPVPRDRTCADVV